MNQLEKQQEIALNYSLSEFERTTQGITNFNKKVLFAIKYIARITQKYNPAIYRSYLLHDAPKIFETMFVNVNTETKFIPFKTFMMNVAPYIPKVLEKDEEFLFSNYKQVDLLAKLPLCEFKTIDTEIKEQIWSKLHDLISFIDQFQQFCSQYFSQQMEQVSNSILPNLSPENINQTLTSMNNINKDDMMNRMSEIQTNVLSDETKSQQMFDEFQKLMPKEIFEMGFGRPVNSMNDLISIVQTGLQEINQNDITKCMNELRGGLLPNKK